MPEQGLSKKKLVFALIDLWNAFGGDWVRVRDALVARFPGYEKAIDEFLANTARNTESLQFLSKASLVTPDEKARQKKAVLLKICSHLAAEADKSTDPEFVKIVDQYLDTVAEAIA